jgi:signal transduction histidine kinase
MHTGWVPPARWVFGVATLLGTFSSLQSYRLSTLSAPDPSKVEVWPLFVLNFTYWFVPAALTTTIFRFARRVGRHSLPRAIVQHAGAVLAFSVIHLCSMLAVRQALWGSIAPPTGTLATAVQRTYLMNLDWLLMTYAAIVGLSYAVRYYQEAQDRAIGAAQLETRLAEARLRTLEAELHPHFLFNTLHAISTLVHVDPEAADRMISRLSDLLRITLDRSAAARIPLQEELEFLQKYLEIEQTRFQDRLTVRFDVDPETLDAEVPRLILQPLVENAIKHGVSPRTGPGVIEIVARREPAAVWLEVRDNGVGLSGGARARLHGGVGLSNTRARLECLYPGSHALEFSDGREGLTVRMRIPFNSVPAESGGTVTRVA